MMKITDLCHHLKWENLTSRWPTECFFTVYSQFGPSNSFQRVLVLVLGLLLFSKSRKSEELTGTMMRTKRWNSRRCFIIFHIPQSFALFSLNEVVLQNDLTEEFSNITVEVLDSERDSLIIISLYGCTRSTRISEEVH